ncbi:MAG: prepilin peptidase [Anaerolineaceae bacterium]|nr:prepilin peptidase [Anaerolineaceae bacterium]
MPHLLASFFGLSVGWLICWLSDWLPAQLGRNRDALSTPASAPEQAGKVTPLSLGVMLGTAVLYTYLYHRLQFSGNFFFLAGLTGFLILLAVIDVKYRLILNVLIVPAIAIILLYQFWPVTQASWFALLGGMVIFFLFMLVAILSPGGLGGGDVKLATLLGVTFGLPYVFWALLAGALMGGGTAVFLMFVRGWQRKTHIPYGPFLCLGAIVALLVNPIPWLLSLLR